MLRALSWLILAGLVSAGAALAVPRERHARLETEARNGLRRCTGRWRPAGPGPRRLAERLPEFPGRRRWIAWTGVVAARWQALKVWGVPGVLLFVAASMAGLLKRVKTARGDRIPSPALAHLSKKGVRVSIIGAALWALLPVGIPLWLGPMLILAAVGLSGVYLANLPDRV